MKNQLQFSLSKGPSAANLALRHPKLQPVIVEKIGQHGEKVMPPVAFNLANNFQFSALSKEKLDMAVQLAKRDIKKKRHDDELKIRNSKGDRSRSASPQGRKGTKVTRGRLERQRQADGRTRSSQLKVRERVGKGIAPFTKRTQKFNVQVGVSGSSTPERNRNLPVTTDSPPTKDSGLNPRRALSKDEQQLAEIERLQIEVQMFVSKILTIIQKIVDADLSDTGGRNLRGEDSLHLGTEEGEVRRRLRSEEQATRSARTVYFLKQQVRGIEEEFTRFGAEKIRLTKKGQMLTRLLSALRGAVRALQTYITQLQNHLPLDGPPSGFDELASLIRQLTALITKLIQENTDDCKTETKTSETLQILDQVQELFSVWNEERQVIMASQARKKSPERREPNRQQRNYRQGRSQDSRQKGLLKKQSRKAAGRPLSPGKQRSQVQRKPILKNAGPERKAALRAGIAALVQGQPFQEKRDNFSRSTEHAPQTGLLLPHHLKKNHTEGYLQDIPSGHFAEPTMAFNLKSVTHQRNPITEPRCSSAPSSPSRNRSLEDLPKEPHWVPSGSNIRTPERAPRTRSHSPGCETCTRYRGGSLEDLSMELFTDERKPQQVKGRVHFSRSRSPSPPDSHRYKRRSPQRKAEQRHSEQNIHRRMAPLYLKANDFSKKSERKPRRASNFVMDKDLDRQTQGEVLSELLFNDLLAETAEEFQTIEGDNSMRKQAAGLMQNGSLSVMLQRLEEMQLERDTIRQRWTTVDYEELETTPLRDDFISSTEPTVLEVNSHTSGSLSSYQRPMTISDIPNRQPILFTKSSKAINRGMKCIQADMGAHNSQHPTPRLFDLQPQVKVDLSEEVRQAIWDNLEQYEGYLKRTLYSSTGSFDPWQLVKEVSDEILEDCLTEVAGEMEDMSADIVNHLCKAEFELTTDPPPVL